MGVFSALRLLLIDELLGFLGFTGVPRDHSRRSDD
jgi:hypothetical protein